MQRKRKNVKLVFSIHFPFLRFFCWISHNIWYLFRDLHFCSSFGGFTCWDCWCPGVFAPDCHQKVSKIWHQHEKLIAGELFWFSTALFFKQYCKNHWILLISKNMVLRFCSSIQTSIKNMFFEISKMKLFLQ